MISIEQIVAAARLSPTVGPFTIRRLFLRARVYSAGPYTADETRSALPGILSEMRETLSPADFQSASAALDALIEHADTE